MRQHSNLAKDTAEKVVKELRGFSRVPSAFTRSNSGAVRFAEDSSRCKVRQRNRGHQTKSLRRCRLIPSVTNIHR